MKAGAGGMRGVEGPALAALLFTLFAGAATLAAEQATTPAGGGGKGETDRLIAAVSKIVKGGKVSDDELRKLDRAVIRLESDASAGGIRVERGVEGPPGEGFRVQKNIYILRVGKGDDERQRLRMLLLQKEILKNQLFLLKALTAIARHQSAVGTRVARVESRMRDMTLGMKSSRRQMLKVRGETAGTAACTKDINRTTVAMARTLEDVEKQIEDLSGTLTNVDMMLGDVSESIEEMK